MVRDVRNTSEDVVATLLVAAGGPRMIEYRPRSRGPTNSDDVSEEEPMARRRWSDLSSREQAAVLTLACVQLSLAATAWADLARRPAAGVNGSKLRWAFVIAVNFVGPGAYFRWGRRRS